MMMMQLYDIGILHSVNHYMYGNKHVYSWDTCIVYIYSDTYIYIYIDNISTMITIQHYVQLELFRNIPIMASRISTYAKR